MIDIVCSFMWALHIIDHNLGSGVLTKAQIMTLFCLDFSALRGTQKQGLRTSGIWSKAINHPFKKTLLVCWFFHGERSSYTNQTSVQFHTNSAFYKFVEELLQIDSCYFSRRIKLRVLPLSAVTASLNYLPRCVLLAVTSHMCQRAYYCNLKWTLKICCDVIVTQ